MSTLDVTRAELALIVLYLNKAESRDKICRAIQYGSKFLSNGQPGTAQNVDKQTSAARKVFRLFKFVNDLHALISPVPAGTPVPIILLGKLGELGRLSASMKKLEKELKGSDKHQNEQYRAKVQKYNDRSLALVRAAMDIVVAAGLLQLAPKKITPRVTGAFGFVTSLIACYQVREDSPGIQYKASLFGFGVHWKVGDGSSCGQIIWRLLRNGGEIDMDGIELSCFLYDRSPRHLEYGEKLPTFCKLYRHCNNP
ncbi:hypothetical protein Cgig2_026353 [Carnegiea gigantea]|uniref:Peroxisomal membrane protein 11C n=1 Tax=Carnegiea gigantea TaxID=171969 RepID=A0A9Q1QGQ7_9CARY|nr:hypothetical protein Cgig2_026353 [Carnegiea gigantea]